MLPRVIWGPLGVHPLVITNGYIGGGLGLVITAVITVVIPRPYIFN